MGRAIVFRPLCVLAAVVFLLALWGCEGPMLASIKLKLAAESTSVSTPTFSPPAGTFDTDQNVTISSEAGSTVYYTTDGSTPSASSAVYSSPIPVVGNGTKTIKAYAAKTGMKDSSVATAAYTIAYPDFVGTWIESYSGGQETVVLTTTTETVTDSGTINGTLGFSVTSYDVSVKHIQVVATSATGDFSGVVTVGTVFYGLYSIAGSSMYIAMDTAGYPTTTVSGPYIKQ